MNGYTKQAGGTLIISRLRSLPPAKILVLLHLAESLSLIIPTALGAKTKSLPYHVIEVLQ